MSRLTPKSLVSQAYSNPIVYLELRLFGPLDSGSGTVQHCPRLSSSLGEVMLELCSAPLHTGDRPSNIVVTDRV